MWWIFELLLITWFLSCNALALDKAYLNTFNIKCSLLWCMEVSCFSICIQKEKLRDWITCSGTQRVNLNESRELKADLLQPQQVPVPTISFSLSNHSIRLLSKDKTSMTAPEQQNIFQPCLCWYNFLTFLSVCWTRGWIPAQQDTQRVLNGKHGGMPGSFLPRLQQAVGQLRTGAVWVHSVWAAPAACNILRPSFSIMEG